MRKAEIDERERLKVLEAYKRWGELKERKRRERPMIEYLLRRAAIAK
jgi:hypothetical protein